MALKKDNNYQEAVQAKDQLHKAMNDLVTTIGPEATVEFIISAAYDNACGRELITAMQPQG